jgi:hypothetical protein
MAQDVFVAVGFRELIKATRQMEPDTRRYVRAAFRQAGEQVRQEAASLFSGIDSRSAAGFKVRVRQRGIAVEQSLRKTTGLRPDYGALMMRRALLPARADKADETATAIDEALDKVVHRFEAGP